MTEVSLETRMNVLDTLHDFCKTERGDGDAAGDKRIEFMRPYITNLLKKKISAISTQTELNTMIKELTDRQVTSISQLEHQSVDFFEGKYPDKFNLGSGSKRVVTYDTIFKAWDANKNESDNPLWKELRDNQDITILELVKGTSKDYNPDKLSEPLLGILGNFFLNFMFGAEMLTGGKGIGSYEDVRITFDAKTGIPGKIFTKVNQVKNIMFPQTIADSATTSLNILNGRSEYIFPGDGKSIPIESASFSKDEYSLSYTNKGFTNKNPFGFSLDIKSLTGGKGEISAPFGATQTEGPSVNYIIDILKTAATKQQAAKFTELEKSKKANILSLGKAFDASSAGKFKQDFINKVVANSDGLLPDIKRSGDHEAAIVTKKTRDTLYKYLIFITIDILCALKSRELKNPTIWHNNHHIILYRFPPSPEQQTEIRTKLILSKLKSAIDIIERITNLKANLVTKLDTQKAKFTAGKNAFFKLKKKDKEITDPSEQSAEEIVTMLARYRMTILEQQCDLAKQILNGFTTDLTAQLTSAKSVLTKVPEKTLKAAVEANSADPTVKIDKVDVRITTDILDKVSSATKDFSEKIEKALDIYVDEQTLSSDKKKIEKTFTFEKDVIETKTEGTKSYQMFKADDFPLFQYFPQNFLDLYETFIALFSFKKVPGADATASMKRKYNSTFDKTLETYENQIESLLNQFVDKNKTSIDGTSDIDSLSEILDFTNLPFDKGEGEDKEDARRKAVREYLQTTLQTKLKTFVEGKDAAVQMIPYKLTNALKGGHIQSGGNQDLILQHYDLSLLLFHVSSMAAAFFESAYAKEYPYWSLLYLHTELVDDINKRVKDNDISFLKSKLITLYNAIDPFRNTQSTIAESVKFDQVPDPSKKTYTTAAEMIADCDKIKEFFDVLKEDTQPTLDAFFTTLLSKGYNEDNDLDLLLAEMFGEWAQGYGELVFNTAYDFVPGDDTSVLIGYLLSLDENVKSYYEYEGSLGRRAIKNIVEIDKQVNAVDKTKRILTIMFSFACLENVMNPTKESCFITKTATKQFASQTEWTSLYSLVSTIVGILQKQMTTQFRLTIANLSAGGGKRKYAKKTRKHHKKTKKSKRMTKRRR